MPPFSVLTPFLFERIVGSKGFAANLRPEPESIDPKRCPDASPSGPREDERMTLFYAIGGIVSLGLFVYLLVALLKPEVFS